MLRSFPDVNTSDILAGSRFRERKTERPPLTFSLADSARFSLASQRFHFVGKFFQEICNGNRTEWSPIRSVVIRVTTKSDDRVAGGRFVYHEYDYRLNWTTRGLVTNLS